MYKSVVNLKTIGEFDTLKEATKVIFLKVKELVAKGEMCYQLLETAVWIEAPKKLPVFFYDIRDSAYDEGWIKNGEWVD